jgi:protein required for attachment to host cells
MPQQIADMDRKKWIRSSHLEDEREDHQWKLHRTTEEMSQTDQLNTKRHLLTMEQIEDLSRQVIDHKFDTQLQSMQFRSLNHAQDM